MNTSVENEPSGSLDFLKWSIIVLLLASAVFGNIYFAEQSMLIRAVAVVVLIIVAGLIAMQTTKGRSVVSFAKESRIEVRKVVWPTRSEAIQTTGIVLVATLIMSLILWGLDTILFKVVGLITGLQIN